MKRLSIEKSCMLSNNKLLNGLLIKNLAMMSSYMNRPTIKPTTKNMYTGYMLQASERAMVLRRENLHCQTSPIEKRHSCWLCVWTSKTFSHLQWPQGKSSTRKRSEKMKRSNCTFLASKQPALRHSSRHSFMSSVYSMVGCFPQINSIT